MDYFEDKKYDETVVSVKFLGLKIFSITDDYATKTYKLFGISVSKKQEKWHYVGDDCYMVTIYKIMGIPVWKRHSKMLASGDGKH